MAVPKKRTGKSSQATRRANWKATKPEVTTCPNCGELVLAHTVCTACGFYKGKPASIKAASVEAVAEKKVAKATSKKVEEVKEVVEEKAEVAEKPAKAEKAKASEKTAEKKETKAKTTAKKTTKKSAEKKTDAE